MADENDRRRSPADGTKPGRPRSNQQGLLDAAAAVFVASGIDAPVREIATAAGVGVGTIYRHFPTRADLVVAVYRHQVEACAEAGPRLLIESDTAETALRTWVGLFVEFLVTKHGLAGAMQGDSAGYDALHTYFVDRLVPVCGTLVDAALPPEADRIDPYLVLKGVGNLCIGTANDPRYDAKFLVQLLISGLLGQQR